MLLFSIKVPTNKGKRRINPKKVPLIHLSFRTKLLTNCMIFISRGAFSAYFCTTKNTNINFKLNEYEKELL
jgi:hypothetical protein